MPEPRIALDLLPYQLRIWEQWLKAGHRGPLPVILPVVVYHGRTAWRTATHFGALVEAREALSPYIPDFCYILLDLTHCGCWSQTKARRLAVIKRRRGIAPAASAKSKLTCNTVTHKLCL